MMNIESIRQVYRQYRSLYTHRISALPVVILMPHSACNCRCVMCDIWKNNQNLQQLNEKDVEGLMDSLKKSGTKRVVMSGGEALLNPGFFGLCEILQTAGIRISLLSTGLLLKRHAAALTRYVNDIIVSLDGPPELHDTIRNVKGAYAKMEEGVKTVKQLQPGFPISARTVIHRMNFRHWKEIIDCGSAMGLDQLSFLPADVSSHAFNREVLWSNARQEELLPGREELEALKAIILSISSIYKNKFESGFIAESPEKLMKIYEHYAAIYGLNEFPYKKCNAPWVSTVIEADGTVRPCFFHQPIGNIHQQPLDKIINSEKAMAFRKNLDIMKDPTCVKCVCYLNLRPGAAV